MTAYSKARIELSRQMLSIRNIDNEGHGCDGCQARPICDLLTPADEVMCELSDEEAGISNRKPGLVLGVRASRAA